MRILHVVGAMVPHGLETWLANVCSCLGGTGYSFDFCCVAGYAGDFEPMLRSLNCNIHLCAVKGRLLPFFRDFRRIVREGEYDIVHSHVHWLSGYVLWLAYLEGARNRYVSIYGAPQGEARPMWRHLYEPAMKLLVKRFATGGTANCEIAMKSFYGEAWRRDRRWRLVYCGVDLERLSRLQNRDGIRERHKIPKGVPVLGHVGRFFPVKNHEFILEVAEILERQGQEFWLMLVGDGPLKAACEQAAGRKGLRRVVFTGRVDNVEPYLGAMDALIFPSLYEGLPQAVLEAQAIGLRCICSTRITEEVRVVPRAVTFLPLEAGAAAWAAECVRVAGLSKLDCDAAMRTLRDSRFSLDRSAKNLFEFYAAHSERVARYV